MDITNQSSSSSSSNNSVANMSTANLSSADTHDSTINTKPFQGKAHFEQQIATNGTNNRNSNGKQNNENSRIPNSEGQTVPIHRRNRELLQPHHQQRHGSNPKIYHGGDNRAQCGEVETNRSQSQPRRQHFSNSHPQHSNTNSNTTNQYSGGYTASQPQQSRSTPQQAHVNHQNQSNSQFASQGNGYTWDKAAHPQQQLQRPQSHSQLQSHTNSVWDSSKLQQQNSEHEFQQNPSQLQQQYYNNAVPVSTATTANNYNDGQMQQESQTYNITNNNTFIKLDSASSNGTVVLPSAPSPGRNNANYFHSTAELVNHSPPRRPLNQESPTAFNNSNQSLYFDLPTLSTASPHPPSHYHLSQQQLQQSQFQPQQQPSQDSQKYPFYQQQQIQSSNTTSSVANNGHRASKLKRSHSNNSQSDESDFTDEEDGTSRVQLVQEDNDFHSTKAEAVTPPPETYPEGPLSANMFPKPGTAGERVFVHGALQVTEQPSHHGRFRYTKEKRRTSLKGREDGKFTTIAVARRFHHLIADGTLVEPTVVSRYSDSNGDPILHWHSLEGKMPKDAVAQQIKCGKASFSNLVVRRHPLKTTPAAASLKNAAKLGVTNPQDDQMVIRLLFTVNFTLDDGTPAYSRVITDVIHGVELKIVRTSRQFVAFRHSSEMIFLTTKTSKKNTAIRITDSIPAPANAMLAHGWTMDNNGYPTITIVPLMVHQQCSIVTKFPRFWDQSCEHNRNVHVRLVDSCKNLESPAIRVQYRLNNVRDLD